MDWNTARAERSHDGGSSTVPRSEYRGESREQGRNAFVSGKSRQNAVKTMVPTDQGGRCCFVARPCPAAVRIYHPRPPTRTVQSPGRRAASADTRRRQLSRPGCLDRWARRDTADPQVQEERPELVRADLPAQAQGALLTAHLSRAQRRPFEESALAIPPPGTARAYEPHHPSHRRPALPSADREPDSGPATANALRRSAALCRLIMHEVVR